MTAWQRLRLRIMRWLVPAAFEALYLAGTLFHRPRLRMLGLRRAAERRLARGRLEAARRLADELLFLAAQQSPDWNTGNALHHGHLLLGRVALARGNVQEAGEQLLAAGRTPGSPQLNTFGPNCRLARDLLAAGQASPVLAYLEECGKFWQMDVGRLGEWMAAIRAGRIPAFGANLAY